jgi:DNA helicase-2/ATP-dependent DNA helicase PcrA
LLKILDLLFYLYKMVDENYQALKFRELYNELDIQQKEAVESTDKLVLVIGSAGTGKTRVLTTRISKMIFDKNVQPENILFLSTSIAKVAAMRKRLLNIIGPDAYKTNLYTFSDFGKEILQDNASLFEKSGMDEISLLEKISIYRRLIDTLPKHHPLKRYRGDVYHEINNLQTLFTAIKQQGWTTQYINQKLDEYVAAIVSGETGFEKFVEDNNIDLLAAETKRIEKFRAAVNEFDRFQQLMISRNRYEKHDVLTWILKEFEENFFLLKHYQKLFTHIFIDDIQDLSGLELRFVQQLADANATNIFVTSLSSERLKSVEANTGKSYLLMKNFKDNFSTILLDKNHRSVPALAALLNNWSNIENEHQHFANKHSNSYLNVNQQELKSCIKIIEYGTVRHEMMHITLQIKELIKQGNSPSEIGIFSVEQKWNEAFVQHCKLENIPVHNKLHLNLLDSPLIKKVVLLLSYLAAEHDTPFGGDEMLFEILHFDFLEIAPIYIAKLSVEVADEKFTNERTSLRKLLFDKANLPADRLFQNPLHYNLVKASAIIERLIGLVANVTLTNLVGSIIKETGLLAHVLKSEDRHFSLSNLTGFFDFIKEETTRNPQLTLQALVDIIELMRRENITIPFSFIDGCANSVHVFGEEDEGEYDYLFLAGATATNSNRNKGLRDEFSFPKNFFIDHQDEQKEKLKKLFHSKLAKSKKRVFISYSLSDSKGHLLEPSHQVLYLQKNYKISIEKVALDETIQSDFASLPFTQAEPPGIAKIDEDIIERLLSKFVMNVSALNNYLKCPLDFYFNNIIRVPRGKSEATEFGSAVHHALQLWFEKMQANNNIFPALQELMGDFNWYMHRHRELFTKEQFERRLDYGYQVLSNYYNNYIGSFHKIVAVERNIRNVVVDGVPLKGKIDKIEFSGKTVNVVDYKTGDFHKALYGLQAPNEHQPNGGNYWRQAVFYKILVECMPAKDWKVTSSEFDFIEPDENNVFRKEKIRITEEDVQTVTNQITDVWQKIHDRQFYKGCGKENCYWCNFVKANRLDAKALVPLAAGSLINQH